MILPPYTRFDYNSGRIASGNSSRLYLKGRLNPIRDTHDRTYLYASNISIERGKQQSVHFTLGEELILTDSDGREMLVRIVEILGRSCLLEHRNRARSGKS